MAKFFKSRKSERKRHKVTECVESCVINETPPTAPSYQLEPNQGGSRVNENTGCVTNHSTSATDLQQLRNALELKGMLN